MYMYTGLWSLVFTLTVAVDSVASLPQNPTTPRSSPPIGETIRQLSNQLMEVNTTSQLTFDTRTPPKVRQQVKRDKPETLIENSHPGIAEPVDDETLTLEEATKKINFYKLDKPTTDSGLSTWILLSGQPSTTNKPNKKPAIPKNITNTVIIEDKIIKPIFKRKSTTLPTTKKPTTILSSTLKATVTATTSAPEKTTKLTKVKASLLNSAINKNATHFVKKATTPKTSITASTTTTSKPTKTAKTTTSGTSTTQSTVSKSNEFVKIPTKINNSTTISNETIESNLVLSPEAKDGGIELTTQSSKKGKRPVVTSVATKKKKNKNRRKRPTAEDKLDNTNNTKLITKHKEKPIGTQIYNYLSREVMPTVGVGLVGLMVTAGLASYFLYPFGPVRRTYQVDRKDKEVNYYYNDEYSGGMKEEDAIAKVIAGMPNSNTNTYSNSRVQNSRNTYPNRYRHVDQRYMQGSVETVQLNPHTNYKTEDVVLGTPLKNDYNVQYDPDISNPIDTYKTYNKEDSTPKAEEEKKFVVGNVPKEFKEMVETATPAIVPEHGPRTLENREKQEEVFIVKSVPASESNKFEHGPRYLRIRKRRQTENELDNEIDVGDKIKNSDTSSTTEAIEISTKHPFIERTETIIEILKDLFYFKIRLGLQILQDKTESLSRYFRTVQERIDMKYREANQNQTST